jgi:SOS-response transcriptional repressor LexA
MAMGEFAVALRMRRRHGAAYETIAERLGTHARRARELCRAAERSQTIEPETDLPVTDRQREVLRAVLRHTRKHGRSPTYLELARALSVSSTNAVACHVVLLERKGCIVRAPATVRGLALTPLGEREAGRLGRRSVHGDGPRG